MLDGKKVAILVGEKTAECAIEISEIIRAVKGASARVCLLSNSRKIIQTGGDIERVTVDIGEARAEDFDAVIICNDCKGADTTARLPCLKFLQDAWDKGKLIAAIGKGLNLVNSANLTEGEDVKSFEVDDFQRSYEIIGNNPKIAEVNLILARKPINLMHFVNTVIKALQERRTQV